MERTERTETVQACMRPFSMTQWYFNLVGKECLFNKCYCNNWQSIWKKLNKQKKDYAYTSYKRLKNIPDRSKI